MRWKSLIPGRLGHSARQADFEDRDEKSRMKRHFEMYNQNNEKKISWNQYKENTKRRSGC